MDRLGELVDAYVVRVKNIFRDEDEAMLKDLRYVDCFNADDFQDLRRQERLP